MPKKITVTVFKVPGETNTDDLSPAPDAWSRPDIPLHYLAMLKNTRPGAAFTARGRRQARPDAVHRGAQEEGPPGRLRRRRGRHRLVSRKCATNSVIWATGEDIPFVPNKRFGGVTLGGKIAPIFFNTQEDSGALPIEVDVRQARDGRRDRHPAVRRQDRTKDGETVGEFKLKSDVLFDEVRAGGRINLIIGRSLTAQGARVPRPARVHRVPPAAGRRSRPRPASRWRRRWSAAPCGLPEGQGVRPGTYCEPKMTTVGSQDTTGPMTRDELKDLACLGFSRRPGDADASATPRPIRSRST